MHMCDLSEYERRNRLTQYVYYLDSDVDSRINSLSRIHRNGVHQVLEFQRSLAFPSIDDIIFALQIGNMVYFPVTSEAVKRFDMVYCRSAAENKGR